MEGTAVGSGADDPPRCSRREVAGCCGAGGGGAFPGPPPLNSDRMLLRRRLLELQRVVGRAFTLDAACNRDGSNSHCARFCSEEFPFTQSDVSGQQVWCNPPFQLGLVREWVLHFMQCRARKPMDTGGAFMVPAWKGFAEVFQQYPDFQLLKEYPPGTVLFSKPRGPDGSDRCTLPGVPWPVHVWYAPPQTEGKVAAMKGSGPMCYNAHVGMHPAVVMLDSGATTKADNSPGHGDDGYVSAAWALRHGFTPERANITHVRMANDQATRLDGRITVPIRMGTYVDRISLLVMQQQLEGVDVILGTDWMKRRGVGQLYGDGEFRVLKGKVLHILEPMDSVVKPAMAVQAVAARLAAQSTDRKIPVVSARRAVRDIRRGARGMFLRIYVSPVAGGQIASTQPGAGHGADVRVEGLSELMVEFNDVFEEMNELPPERDVAHSIPLVDNPKVPSKRMYRLSPREKEEVERQVKKLLEMGFIRPSTSAFGAPVLFVDKPDGSLRMCLDYRALNEITVKRRFPMPNIADLFDQLQGAKIFSSLDLQQGYYQIRIPEEDVSKTAFMTHLGQFEFKVLCMGLTNAPATFQETMNRVFAPYLGKFVLVYLDDIMVYSKSAEEHKGHLRIVLELLRKHKFYAKMSKCDFCKREVKFLGHIVSEEGLRVDPAKVEVVQKWPTPNGVTQLRSFLGMANYFRKFIQGYSSIVAPLTALTASKVIWEWSDICKKAFEEVKKALTQAPVLALPDPTKPYVVLADASIHGTGGILMQEDRVVAYLSHKFDSAQRNYSTTDQECLGIIHALTEWRCYVEGGDVTLVTDHQPLTHLQSLTAKGPLSRRHARWMEILSRFHFKWQYRKGSENAADGLSRLHGPSEVGLPVVMSLRASLVALDFREQLVAGYAEDTKFQDAAHTQAQGWQQDADSGLWMTKHHKVVVPVSKVDLVLKELHDSALGAHQGVNRTQAAARARFYWKGMNEDIARYVLTCPKCQANKASTAKQGGLLQPLPVAKKPWWSISMDFVLGLPTTGRGHDAILVIVDRFSKMVHFVATTSTCTAVDVAKMFQDNVIRLHGVPHDIVSDRDSKFTGHFWGALTQALQTELKLSTSFHPQTDGQTERLNRVLEEALRSACGTGADWDDHLSLIEFGINNSVAASTGTTPFMLNQLDPPRMLIDQDLPELVPVARRFTAVMQERLEAATRCLKMAQDRQATYANQHRREVEFQEEDLVLLNTNNLRKAMPGKAKLQPRYVGPFKVIKRIGQVAYKLELPPAYRIHPVFHVSLLKRYNARKETGTPVVPALPTQPILEVEGKPGVAFTLGGDKWFTVQDIVGHQDRKYGFKRNGKRRSRTHREYLVRWQGYGPEDDTWESARKLLRDSLVEDMAKAYCARNGVPFKKA